MPGATMSAVGAKPAAASSSFNPLTDIAWHSVFIADSITATDGDPITLWDDSSGNARPAGQGTSSRRPLYRSSVAAFNGQPALEFDGVDDSLAQSVFTAITNRTIVIVGRNTYTGTPALSYFCDGLDNSNRSVVGRWPDTTDWLIQAGTNLAGGTPDSNLHLFVADFAATDALYIDGTSIFSGNAGTHGTTGLRIGVDRTSTGNPLLGFIAFIGLYEGTLDATAKANLRTWAQTKYGTP